MIEDKNTEIISISTKRAKEFGLVKKIRKGAKEYSVQPITINDTKVKVDVSVALNGKSKKLSYPKEAMTSDEHIFIAFMYLLIGDSDYSIREKNKKMAADHLRTVLMAKQREYRQEGKEEDVLPYYLALKYDLEIRNVGSIWSSLYRFLHKPETFFLDFYLELWRKEKNYLRQLGIAKIGLKHYPNNEIFIRVVARDLYQQGKYSECVKWLQKKKEAMPPEIWETMFDARVYLTDSLLKEGKDDEALEEMNKPLRGYWGNDFSPLLKGIFYYNQKDWSKAITNLEKAIQMDYSNDEITSLASYFLVECYIQADNQQRVKDVIESLTLNLFDSMPMELPDAYKELAEKQLLQATESKILDDKDKAKLGGIYALALSEKLPNQGTTDSERKLTANEEKILKQAFSLCEMALSYFPYEGLFNAVYSNLLLYKRRFDEAMDYSLRSLMSLPKPDEDAVIYASLENCSEEYLPTYPQRVAEITKIDSDDWIDSGPRLYAEHRFESDVSTLWHKKMYPQIATLYLQTKPYIKEIGELGEIYRNGSLFEIAYSLGEVDAIDEAEQTYQQYVKTRGESSAVLNNLAIIAEKKGDLEKAGKLLEKAKKLDPDDSVVLRNFRRIVTDHSSNTHQPDKAKEVVKEKPQDETPKNLKVSVKDREILINHYIAARPHYGRPPLEFFLYIQEQPANTKITKDSLPAELQAQIGTRSFAKVLENCGFTQELRKAFFPEIGPKVLKYRGNNVSIAELKKHGVNIEALIKQLEFQHLVKRRR